MVHGGPSFGHSRIATVVLSLLADGLLAVAQDLVLCGGGLGGGGRGGGRGGGGGGGGGMGGTSGSAVDLALL